MDTTTAHWHNRKDRRQIPNQKRTTKHTKKAPRNDKGKKNEISVSRLHRLPTFSVWRIQQTVAQSCGCDGYATHAVVSLYKKDLSRSRHDVLWQRTLRSGGNVAKTTVAAGNHSQTNNPSTHCIAALGPHRLGVKSLPVYHNMYIAMLNNNHRADRADGECHVCLQRCMARKHNLT